MTGRPIDDTLERVRGIIRDAVADVPLEPFIQHHRVDLTGGKMLRARLLLHMTAAAGSPLEPRVHAAAAIEMLQTASLLHDDILDAGTERRGAPALWVSAGAKAAVLMGDMLLSKAFSMVANHVPATLPMLAEALAGMCQAEIVQSAQSHSAMGSWEECLDIARHKTGALFGYAARCATDDRDLLATQLQQAGINLGTAYQVADDLLDAHSQPPPTGKTLGTDAQSGKLTAARFLAPDSEHARQTLHALLDAASAPLARRPQLRLAFDAFVGNQLRPLLRGYFGPSIEGPNAP